MNYNYSQTALDILQDLNYNHEVLNNSMTSQVIFPKDNRVLLYFRDSYNISRNLPFPLVLLTAHFNALKGNTNLVEIKYSQILLAKTQE